MSDDVLASLSVNEVAAFYRRLADAVDKEKGDLKVSLAAMLMRHWLDNRDASSTFEFDAPDHLRANSKTFEALQYHRAVFLTEQKARITGGNDRWAGILPRLQGKPGFQKWDGKGVLKLDYQSLVEIPLRWQLTGSDGERDLLYSLHGFQLKTYVTVALANSSVKGKQRVVFQRFDAQARDRYDWDYSEHLTVPNPDHQRKQPGAVSPGLNKVVVYHKNAKRLEDAKLAAPYDLSSKTWPVADARISGAADIDPWRKL